MSNGATERDAPAPVIKSFGVPLSPADAFTLFTDEIQRWWPLETHSVFGADAVSCVIEGSIGGRIYEVHADGRQSEWGIVTQWEPPQRFGCTWHPGRQADTQQDLDVHFEETAEGTRVTLTHRGWERLGTEALPTRKNYEHGWDRVLAGYCAQAELVS